MSIDVTTIENALRAWVVSESGLGDEKVIWADPNAPRPAIPYITVKISGLVGVGQDYHHVPSDVAGTVRITGNREFTFNVQHFGTGGLGTLETVRGALEKVSVRDALKVAGVCVYEPNEAIQNVTELIESRYTEQQSLDFMCRTNSEVDDVVGTIESVEVEETIKDPTGAVVHNDTYTISTT